MTENLTSKRLLKTIKTHTQNWNEFKNERITEYLEGIMNDLKVRTDEMKDLVVALYLANFEINNQITNSIQGIRTEQDESKNLDFVNQLFEQQNVNIHIENILTSLHEKESFESMYKPDQFYHYINRFVRTEMVVPAGFSFMFAYRNQQGEQHHVLAKVDKEAIIGELLDSAFFGFLMPEPKTKEERVQFIEHIFNNSNADLVSVEQAEAIEKSVQNLTVLNSSDLINEYFEVCQRKVSVE